MGYLDIHTVKYTKSNITALLYVLQLCTARPYYGEVPRPHHYHTTLGSFYFEVCFNFTPRNFFFFPLSPSALQLKKLTHEWPNYHLHMIGSVQSTHFMVP